MTEQTKLPKHKKTCAYVADPHQRCTCGVKAIGEPFTHWQDMAEELVMDALVRAFYRINSLSIPGQLAQVQLKEIILQQNPEVFQKVMEERERAMKGLEAFMLSLAQPPKRKRKAK